MHSLLPLCHSGRNSVRRFWLALALAVLPLAGVHAQPTEPEGRPVHFWMQGGPAVTTLGAGMHAGLGVEFDRHVLSLRGTSTDRSVGAETWDVAFLYGRALVVGHVHLSAGAGVAVAGGESYGQLFGGEQGEHFDPMIGFPLEGRASWMPTGVLAVGLYGFANVNTGHPFGGIGASVRVGRLR